MGAEVLLMGFSSYMNIAQRGYADDGLQIQQNHQAAHIQPAPESFRSGSADPATRYSVLRCVFQQSCHATYVLQGVFLGRVTLVLS
jgi:hypothetical protein